MAISDWQYFTMLCWRPTRQGRLWAQSASPHQLGGKEPDSCLGCILYLSNYSSMSKHNFLTALTQMGASLILTCTYQTCFIFLNHSSGRLWWKSVVNKIKRTGAGNISKPICSCHDTTDFHLFPSSLFFVQKYSLNYHSQLTNVHHPTLYFWLKSLNCITYLTVFWQSYKWQVCSVTFKQLVEVAFVLSTKQRQLHKHLCCIRKKGSNSIW